MNLSRSQIESLIGKTSLSPNGKDLYGKCPWCGHLEFGISLSGNNPFNCFRKKHCGISGNAFTLLAFFKKRIIVDEQINPVLSTFEDVIDVEIKELPLVTPPVAWKRKQDDNYLRSRGWTDIQFEKYKVGRSILRKEYVTVLIEMNRQTVAYLSRSEKDKQEIDRINKKRKENKEKIYLRYDNSPGSNFGEMLFGYDEIVQNKTTDVILVEGWLSKTKTDTNLDLDSDDWLKCVATFGAKVSSIQIRLLLEKGVQNIWLWFEGDVLRKVKPIALELENYFNVKTGYIAKGDPNNWDREQCISFFERCVSPIELQTNYL